MFPSELKGIKPFNDCTTTMENLLDRVQLKSRDSVYLRRFRPLRRAGKEKVSLSLVDNSHPNKVGRNTETILTSKSLKC